MIGGSDLAIAKWYEMLPAVSDAEAREKYPGGWETFKPYLRIVPQPGKN